MEASLKKRKPVYLRWIAILIVLATLSGGWALPVLAQEGKPELSAHAAFDGYFKYGEWLPVWVELSNQGRDVEAEVRIRVPTGGGGMTFAAPVSLPSGSHKRLPVYVLPNNFSRELEVQLVEGEDLLASQRVSVKPQANITYFFGLVSPQRGALSQLNGVSFPGQPRPAALIDVSLEDLPERVEGLQSFDCLILNDVDTSHLTSQQTAALEYWVRQGGRLVIGGGAGAQRTAAGLPQTLLAVQPAEVVEVEQQDLAGLGTFAETEGVRVPGPFLLARGGFAQGHLLAGQEEIPLLVERPVGSGFADFAGLDLSSSPFDAWSGATPFWEKLLAPGAAFPEGMPPDISMRQMRSGSIPYALSNMPVLDLPSVRGLGLLLGVYILLVGPVNYLVLHWRKRLHWAWFSIPLITAVFSAGAFGMGYILHGTDLILNKIALIEPQPDGSAGVTSYLGLFSPGQQAYEVEIQGGGLLSPVAGTYDPWSSAMPSGVPTGEMTFVQGQPARVRGLSVSQWSMQSFMAEDTWPDFGTLTADLRLEAGALKGTLRNDTAYDLSDVTLVLNKRFVRLGDLASGAETQVEMGLSDLDSQRFGPPLSYLLFENELNNAGPNGPQREVELKRSIFQSIFEQGPVFKATSSVRFGGYGSAYNQLMLLGWLSKAPPEVSIAGNQVAQQTTGLVYQPLTYHLQQNGAVELPTGILPGSLVQMPKDGGTCGEPGSTAVYIGSGEAVFEFHLPDEIASLHLEALNLSLWSDGGWWRAPQTAFYNWQTGEWDGIEDVVQGVNSVSSPEGLVSQAGLVRLRLSTEQSSQGCYYVGLGLKAAGSQGGTQ
jgi:hypothetical protein